MSWGSRARPNLDVVRSGRTRTGTKPSKSVSSAGITSEGLERQAKRKWAEAESLAKKAAQQVLEEAQVVCATCSGAGDPLLKEL